MRGPALALWGFTALSPECRGGGLRRLSHSGPWAGALVASLRSHILRPGTASIDDLRMFPIFSDFFSCRLRWQWVITTLSCLFPLAGFEVSPVGRF